MNLSYYFLVGITINYFHYMRYTSFATGSGPPSSAWAKEILSPCDSFNGKSTMALRLGASLVLRSKIAAVQCHLALDARLDIRIVFSAPFHSATQHASPAKNNHHANSLTPSFIQTRPRHPHAPPRHTQMLPHDQRRARRAHRRRRAPTATVERRQHEQSPRRASEAVQDQARRHGEVEGSSKAF